MKIHQYIHTKARYRVFTGIHTPSQFWPGTAPLWGFGHSLSKLTMVLSRFFTKSFFLCIKKRSWWPLVASTLNRIFKDKEFDQIFSCKWFCGQNMHLPILIMSAADLRLEKIWKMFAWSSHHFINIWYFKHFICSFHS